MKRKHNLEEVLSSLSRKNDVRIVGSQIQILKDKVFNPKTNQLEINPHKKFDLCNGSWGKMDYLVKVHNYRIYYYSKFENQKANK